MAAPRRHRPWALPVAALLLVALACTPSRGAHPRLLDTPGPDARLHAVGGASSSGAAADVQRPGGAQRDEEFRRYYNHDDLSPWLKELENEWGLKPEPDDSDEELERCGAWIWVGRWWRLGRGRGRREGL